jgi:ribosomal protein S13
VPGVAKYTRIKFIRRFELNGFVRDKKKTFMIFSLEQRKIINMYLSELSSINNNIFELVKYNMVRLYLIKTFRGRCFALGKPSRGQRT